MPFYDYKCNQCGQTTEVKHGMNEKPAVKCEFCHSANTQRVFHTFASVGGGQSSHGSGCSSCGSGTCGSCGH